MKTLYKEWNLINRLLSISASDEKLKSFIVFNGQKNKNLLHEIKENKIIGVTQSNKWVDGEIFIIYTKLF